jgi:UDP-3-O-[3-hydroxymyristoyl] glucosamine N-acyltransferase
LKDLAELVNGIVSGDPGTAITGVAGIEDAITGEITLAASVRMIEKAVKSSATAIIVPENAGPISKPVIKVANPRLAFAQILASFHTRVQCQPGVDKTAVIGDNFQGSEVEVGPLAVIGDDVQIGPNSIISPGVVIGDRVKIGSNVFIHANVVIREDCIIGNQVQIHAGTVIGADGFGYVTVDGKHIKVPQVGKVIIEDDVEIGANVTVDRATTGITLIKSGTKIDNQVQIAHNCQIGNDNMICGQAGIAGSAVLGDRVTLAGQTGLVGHIKVGSDTVVAARSMVINSLPAYSFVSGSPARPHAEDMRILAVSGRLPELLKEIKDLQKKVAEIEERVHS